MGALEKIFVTAALIILPHIASAQGRRADKDTVGSFESMKGVVSTMFNHVELTEERINFMNEGKKWDSERQKNIKWMVVGSRVFFCLPLNKRGTDMQLMEVVALNKQKILVQYWKLDYFYLIYDMEGNMLMEKRKVFNAKTIGSHRNNEKVFEEIKSQFGSCPELIAAMKYNLDDRDRLSNEIEAMRCDGAPELESIVKTLNERYWTKK